MADNKKYYYMRLKENFFDSDEMIILENMDNGDGIIYSNILLKLYLRSLKYEGRLMFNERIPFNPQMLSTIVRHPVGVVEKALKAFVDLGLVEVMDNGAIYMLDIQNFIGKTSTEADRKKIYRAQIAKEKGLLIEDGQMSGQMSDKRTPESESEIEIESEIESKSDDDVGKNSLQSLSVFFSNNFHPISQRELEQLREFVNDSSYEMVRLALEIAVDNNARTIKYVRSIIVNWENNNIKTPESYHAFEAERKRKFASNNQNKFQKQKPVKKAPEWTDEGRLIKAGVDTTGMTQNEMYKLVGEMGLRNE
ncbi:phage replisome organizer N-terminal domain-containing protein [Lactococcus lactis]|uniref:phage replisome organizer N-terminal domain-containing protein n=1 Tax=Lactococcus lactis TaxID=1358 RepID=UPI002938DD5F|nr:phage replisome organizer N-terminal domain-containing protein [Lactococcus lactis]WOF40667.1 phage replisome organizer N-terminal domain-containing protein [Lactococcus lactis]